jgi:hypothetical protein
MIEQPVGSIKIVYHNALVFGNGGQELSIALSSLMTPHLQDVDDLPDIVATALNDSFSLSCVQFDPLSLSHFDGKLLD